MLPCTLARTASDGKIFSEVLPKVYKFMDKCLCIDNSPHPPIITQQKKYRNFPGHPSQEKTLGICKITIFTLPD
jgi:hypothetical protein